MRGKRQRRFALFVSISLAAAAAVFADDDYGGYSVYGDMAAEVLTLPRSAALASADMAANASGPLASNPALAALPVPPALTLGYSSYYGDVFSASSLNYTGRIGDRGGIGATVAYLLIPGIEDTRGIDITAVDTDDIKTFTASDVWARVSYGYMFDTKYAALYAGAAVTARRRRLESLSAHGLGADIGIAARFEKPALSAALLWENVRYSIVRWQDSDYRERVPQHIRLSFAWEHEDPYIYGKIALFYTSPDLLSNEGINYYDKSGDREEPRAPGVKSVSDDIGVIFTSARYGVEYTIMNTLALRAGLNIDGFTLGAGVLLFNQRAGIDFCYVNHELAGTVMMSVTYRWVTGKGD